MTVHIDLIVLYRSMNWSAEARDPGKVLVRQQCIRHIQSKENSGQGYVWYIKKTLQKLSIKSISIHYVN